MRWPWPRIPAAATEATLPETPAPPSPPGSWRVVAASICGRAHSRTNDCCQDAHVWRTLPGDVLIAAVADGAGSASHGGEGAAIAAARAVEHLATAVAPAVPESAAGWEILLRESLAASRTALEEEAVVRELDLRDLATTLIVLAMTPGGFGVGQIGDGAAILREIGGGLTALTRPTDSEYVNHTTFLTSDEALATAQVVARVGPPGEAVALFTDGLQRLALRMPEGEPHEPFFAPLFRFLGEAGDLSAANQELETFLGSARIQERTDDDLTLLLAARPGPIRNQ